MIDWDQLIENDGPAVWRVCWRVLGNRADAEECFQETFVAALQLSRRQDLASPGAVLHHLATARSIDRLRSRERRRARFEAADQNQLDREAPERPSPIQDAQASELSAALRIALAVLPAKQAEVFMLHAVDGWSYQEICDRLGLSIDNVGVLVHRARTKLKVSLAQYAAGESAKADALRSPSPPTAAPQVLNGNEK